MHKYNRIMLQKPNYLFFSLFQDWNPKNQAIYIIRVFDFFFFFLYNLHLYDKLLWIYESIIDFLDYEKQ